MAIENCVGRVSGFAVAFGIGAAVATGWSAPAWADDTAASGVSASEASAGKVGAQTAPSSAKAARGSGAGSVGNGASRKGATKVAGKPAAGPAADDERSAATRKLTVPDTEPVAAAPVRFEPKADVAALRPPNRLGIPAVVHLRSASDGSAPATADTPAEVQSAVAATGTGSEPAAAGAEQAPVAIASVLELTDEHSRSAVDPVSPLQSTAMLTVLGAVRDELERKARVQSAKTVAGQQITVAADSTPNVLVIGVDGTNLARILADPANVNFVDVMQGGTTAVASIAGHTTLSNPSWTAVLTGLWGETTGVINNIYNPGVYDRWPTVFNQLETLDPAIQTTAIADWDVIAGIAASGSIPADSVLYVPQISGDTRWLLTDDAVGDATEAAIAAADPTRANFVFSYFVGVDENGHLYGGASPQYAGAVQNVDRNLGEILQSVDAWEEATGEQWTIIIVTDHGHQPQLGFGHGFQSPDETTTFVIANNPDIFTPSAVNTDYQIVDVTPTVVSLFGGVPRTHSDGVSLTTLDGATTAYSSSAALFGALHTAIADIGYPDAVTVVALGARTVFASIPYFLIDFVDTITGELRAVSDRDNTVLGGLAYLAIGPVQFTGDALYVATNVIAQVVARLTGVTGARIFPLLPPDLPPFTVLCVDPSSVCSSDQLVAV